MTATADETAEPSPPSPTIPAGWQRVASRRYPGCYYYLKPDGEATWLLPGQTRRALPKQLQSIYMQDFVNDPNLIARVNPRNTQSSALRLSSYDVHPKAPRSRDHETYLSLKQRDHVPFAPKRPPKRVYPAYQPSHFGDNSTYRSDFVDFTDPHNANPYSIPSDEECIGLQGIDTFDDTAVRTGSGVGKDRPMTADGRPIYRPSAPAAAAPSCINRSSNKTRPHSVAACGRSLSYGTGLNHEKGVEDSNVRLPFRSRPKDMSHNRHLPFDATSDYRAHFINFHPPRPVLAHPDDKVTFGERWAEGGAAHPNSLYRAEYRGETPYLGRTRKSVIHARMLNIPSHYESRTKKEYVPDEKYAPVPGFRGKVRHWEQRCVQRMKETQELGDGY